MTFFLTSLFVFLVFWRPQEWLVPWLFGFPLLDLIVGAASLTLILESSQGVVRFPRGMPQVWMFAGLWIATLMSHIAQFYFEGLMATYAVTFKLCFFGFLLFCVLDRVSRMRWVVWLIVLMGLFMAIHALLQQHRGYGFGGQTPIMHFRPLRGEFAYRSLFFGIFEDPNDLAQMLAVCVPLVFAVPRRMGGLAKIFSLAGAVLLVLGILATDSRGGQLGLVTSCAMMAVLWVPPRWLPRMMLLMFIGALTLCPLTAGNIDASAHDRVVFWGEANWVFRHHPVFGIGFGMFSEYISGDRAAHNAFVECYTTIGLFGYWFWFGLLQLGLIGAWRTRQALLTPKSGEQEWIRRFAGLALASMAGFMASAYFLSRAFVFPAFFLFALLNAIPVIARNTLPEDYPPLIYAHPDVTILGTAGTLFSVVYVYISILLLNQAFYG